MTDDFSPGDRIVQPRPKSFRTKAIETLVALLESEDHNLALTAAMTLVRIPKERPEDRLP